MTDYYVRGRNISQRSDLARSRAAGCASRFWARATELTIAKTASPQSLSLTPHFSEVPSTGRINPTVSTVSSLAVICQLQSLGFRERKPLKRFKESAEPGAPHRSEALMRSDVPATI